ncbi:hypothetical protein, partial [Virgibacillus sp. SK37]
MSIFPPILPLNQQLHSPTPQKLTQIFLQILIPPTFSHKALQILTNKKN